MYESNRAKLVSSEVFATDVDGGNECDPSDIEEIEFGGDAGKRFNETENAAKSRNKPGNVESPKRGAVNNPHGAPNVPKSPSVCIRCGDTWHFANDSPSTIASGIGPAVFAKYHEIGNDTDGAFCWITGRK